MCGHVTGPSLHRNKTTVILFALLPRIIFAMSCDRASQREQRLSSNCPSQEHSAMKSVASHAVSSIVLLIASTFSQLASAHTVVYSATLSGAAEVPTNASPGTGSVLVTMDFDLLTMDVSAVFSGLLGTTTASHIHCCTLTPGTGNAGVATMTPSFLNFPLGVTSGTYHQVFDMSLASSYNSAFITANGGTVGSAFNAFALGLDSGNAYFNIHTTNSPGGEIRGFLAVAPVPLPAALWLLGSAFAGLTPWLRRRRMGVN
jgi:hypothetical protein